MPFAAPVVAAPRGPDPAPADAPAPASRTPTPRRARPERLPYVPALDGLRAIAVVAVLLYHHDSGSMPGGWLGVSLFFTLSGFLIAGLLVAEHAGTGRVRLRDFWVRRIRRLLPASVIAIGMAFAVLAISEEHRSASVAGDVRAAILNIANWRFVVADAPYAGSEGAPSPVLHYWSLAIEEQFYLVLPLIAAFALRRRLLGWVVGAVVVASLALQLRIDDIDRVYFGTDTRAAELAVGVGLALAFPAVRRVLAGRHRIADAWGAIALVAAVVLFARAQLDQHFVGSGALVGVTVVWVGLLVASVCGRRFPALIATRDVLPALGRISYGVYLYHWPVYLVVTRTRTGFEGTSLLVLRVAITIALAALSSILVELPIRRGAVVPRRVLPVALTAALLVVAATVAVPARGDRPAELALVSPPPVAAPGPAVASAQVEAPVDPAAPPTDAPAPATDGVPVTATSPDAPTPTAVPARVPRLLVVGDSTAGVTGGAMQKVASADGIAEIHVLSVPGCAALRYEVAKVREGYEFRTDCVDIFADAAAAADRIDADAVVVFLGSGQLMDAEYPGLDGWRSVLDGEVASRYRAALDDGLGRLVRQTGLPVLWADMPVPEWDIDAFSEMFGAPLPGHGEAVTNDPARTHTLNALDAEVIDRHPGVAVWPLAAALAGPDGQIPPHARSDGLHLDPAYAEEISRSTLLPLLEETYRSVVSRPDAPRPDAEPNSWSPAAA